MKRKDVILASREKLSQKTDCNQATHTSYRLFEILSSITTVAANLFKILREM